MRSNYWSCTKFADWVRGTPKIPAGTEKEWRAWENIAKRKKVRFWLAEEGLDHLQNIIYWPRNRLQNTRHYIDNRWISKTHALTSSLRKGQWHEFETRLPTRQDPMEASGWCAYCDERRQKAEVQGFDLILPVLEEDETEEEKAHARQILEVCHKMELEQENEDTEMLIRLIKIREHLWT